MNYKKYNDALRMLNEAIQEEEPMKEFISDYEFYFDEELSALKVRNHQCACIVSISPRGRLVLHEGIGEINNKTFGLDLDKNRRIRLEE